MGIYESVRAVSGATGDGPVDWGAVAEAATASTDRGSIDMTAEREAGYETDVRDARDRVRSVAALEFDLPNTIEIQDRHHWIDANVDTFERVMRPLEEQTGLFPGAARVVNTGSMAFALGFLGNNVLGQYDPLLLADTGESNSPSDRTATRSDNGDEHALYFVHPNIERVADELDVEFARFRRWIAFHEVTHAAEFGAAPWLSTHLETQMEEAVEALTEGRLARDSIGELDATMTAVEGYAELVMDRAFDDEYADLRRKVEERRSGHGPVARLVRRLLGLGLKRRQYERGKAFFDAVVDARGIEAAGAVWADPENLPSDDELDDPALWLARVPA
jgi:uncharacterized protein (DUF2342 family)